MSLLLETIKIENGKPCLLPWHQKRFDEARSLLFGTCPPINLSELIRVPAHCQSGIFRCRIEYSRQIEKTEFLPFLPRTFQSLRLVTGNHINYALKYADRSALNQLLAQRGECDEIIIVKNGLLTDCTIGNLVFFDGQHWHTPASPLLRGTQRSHLLAQALIRETEIRISDLPLYQQAGIINVFYNLENMARVAIQNIINF